MIKEEYNQAVCLESNIMCLEAMLDKRNCIYACAKQKRYYGDENILFRDDVIESEIKKLLEKRLEQYKAEFASL